MDVTAWLRKLGLEQYEPAFRENKISADLLPSLTAEDLKDLGVSLVGDRRRLLGAIAALQSLSPAERSSVAEAPPAAAAQNTGEVERAGHEAERRQLTVLFCDLVGSTELSRRLDPEELLELIRRYQDAVSGVVVRHGGYVANFQGDGIVAYFGWPRADEDEAAQAIRAGLDAIAAVQQVSFRNGERLSSRVGIASGMVVVGDLDTAGRRQTGAVAGDTPNLAARLQALAEADQVVIDSLTQHLVGTGFVLDELGPQSLKGFAEPVPVARVLAERATESRFEARKGRLTPFVGREQEMALLLERFERGAAGEGQAVLLSGEAGIGKSRLVQMLCERLAGTPHTRMRMQCSPMYTTSTLYPVLRHLEYAAGFDRKDSPETQLSKLGTLLRQSMDNPAESLAALAPLFVLSGSGSRAAEDLLPQHAAMVLSPQQREARALGALIDQLLGLAIHSPVLFILEDAHWIDPATRELITQTLARTADARVLMVITHRPEFQSDWTRHPQVTALTLNRLSRGQSVEIAHAAAAAALTEEIVARILRRADGVPLFIEELTRSVTDAGSAAGDSVPETLQASLLARLDRLGSDMKEVAQIAAVIGREFGSDLLCAVVGKSKDELAPMLGQLVASQIVLPAGTAQGGMYLFRHALIQDAAYQLLLLSRRRQYHAEIARTLEGRFAETGESHPGLIAQHYTAAALPEQAIPYWVKAGERALARFAYLEPISHFERGLDLARVLPEGLARSRQILNLLLLLAEARFRNKHLHEALKMFREAFDLARTDGSPADLARAASGAQLAESHMGVVQQTSIALLEAALDAFGESDTAERSRVLGRLGTALAQSGAFERATTLMSRATDLARRRGDPRALLEALTYSELYAKVAQPCTGPQFEMRRQLLGEMWNIAEQLGDPDMLPHLFSVSMAAFLEIVDLAGFEAQFSRFEQLLEERRIVGGQNHYLMTTSSAMRAILHGDFVGAERWAEQALEVAHDIQPEVATGVYGVQMFTIRREQGRLAETAPLLRRFLAKNPQESAWRPGLALIASDLGFEQAARKAFDDMATAGFTFAADAKRNITLCYLAEVCARLGDADRAGPLYELLLPYRDLAVVVPSATVCCGATARYLGMLAGLMHDWTAAEQHFEAAVDIDERLQAWPWLAHTKHEFALMLQVRGRPGNRERAQTLLAEAAASAERFGMVSLQSKIRAVAN